MKAEGAAKAGARAGEGEGGEAAPNAATSAATRLARSSAVDSPSTVGAASSACGGGGGGARPGANAQTSVGPARGSRGWHPGPTPTFISGRVSVGSAGLARRGKGRSSRREGEGASVRCRGRGRRRAGSRGSRGSRGSGPFGTRAGRRRAPGDARLGGFAGARGGPSRLASTPRRRSASADVATTTRRRRGERSAGRGMARLARASARRGSGGRRGASPR